MMILEKHGIMDMGWTSIPHSKLKSSTEAIHRCLKFLPGSGQRTFSRHKAFHSNSAYNDIINNFMFFTAFDGRLTIELVILQEGMGE